jgi:ABC-type polysaccharide/polyol phosphate transport system ATPase subunit
MSDTLIKVEGVSKKFCRSLKKSLWYGMQDLGREITGRKHGGEGELRPDEFWAVNDVSFELKRGECLGLIGRNGAGKTTLLRMLNGLIKPDRGRIEMRGRVGALIALGAGFNPILTGRENIYVNASVLGLTKQEIDAKLDEIIDFAEIGEFIDMPVQSYSSGMNVRLGFSVASCLSPDILLLDEVLAVGDSAFRTKCGNRIKELLPNAAVILVTHSMEFVTWYATKALLLEKGCMTACTTDLNHVIRSYETPIVRAQLPDSASTVKLNEVRLKSGFIKERETIPTIRQFEPLMVEIVFELDESINGVLLDVRVCDISGQSILNNSVVADSNHERMIFLPGHHSIVVSLGSTELTGGTYTLTLEFFEQKTFLVRKRREGLTPFFVESNVVNFTKVVRRATFKSILNDIYHF